MDKNGSYFAVAANVYSDVQIQFLWSSYLWDSFAQEKHNFTRPVLVIAKHNFNNQISAFSHVSVPGPWWYHKCFKKLGWTVVKSKCEKDPFSPLFLSFLPSSLLLFPFAYFPVFLVFLGSAIAMEYKSKDHQGCTFFASSQYTLYWSFISFAVLPPS